MKDVAKNIAVMLRTQPERCEAFATRELRILKSSLRFSKDLCYPCAIASYMPAHADTSILF